MNINKVFYFFIFLNYISGQSFGERVISFSKKCLKAKSTYILPLFLASNFYFFTEKKCIAKKTHSAIENYKKELVNLDQNTKKLFEEFNTEFLTLNKMMGESFFSYMFSVFYFFKISDVNFGKKWVFLSWNEKKIIPYYRHFSYCYKKNKLWSLSFQESRLYVNEMGRNFLQKLFLDFFILSLLFYGKSCKSNMLAFAGSFHVLTNMFIKVLQKNHIYFLTKLFLLENTSAINDLKNRAKSEQSDLNLHNNQLELQRKQLKENIFHQNLFVVPIVNQVALAHYCFKNYPSHLICFFGFLSFSLINHIILGYFSSLVLKNTLSKSFSHLPLLFFDLFIFYHYFMQYQKWKKEEEEKKRLKPGETRTSYYKDRSVIEECDLNGNITKTTEFY